MGYTNHMRMVNTWGGVGNKVKFSFLGQRCRICGPDSSSQGNLNSYMTVPRFWPGVNNETQYVGYSGK